MVPQEFDPVPQDERMEAGFDAIHAFLADIPRLIYIARDLANTEAISYRKFHVGTSVVAITYDGYNFATLGGANIKPSKSADKYCAEMNVIDQTENAGFDHIVGMVIAGTIDPLKIEEVSGVITDTLLPCNPCVDKMLASKQVSDDTIVMTVGLEEDVVQVHNVGDFRIIHDLQPEEKVELHSPQITLDLVNWDRQIERYDDILARSSDVDAVRVAKFVLKTVEINQ